VPSVQAQTVKNFDWWFLVDSTFPGLKPTHLDRLEKYGRILYICAPWSEQQPEIGELLSPVYKDQWVCTTRLDSDDMLHERFFERLAATVKEREEWVSFRYGYIIKDGFAVMRDYEVNPFVSYVEYANPLKTVFRVSHIAANRSDAPFQVIPEVGWAQVDHGDNIKNHAEAKVKSFDKLKINVNLIEGFPCIFKHSKV
jgi:hypothetical protein